MAYCNMADTYMEELEIDCNDTIKITISVLAQVPWNF
jgi:hypothetical protein